MIQQARDKVKKHIKTHSEHSVEDRAAISLLGTFLNPGGRINTSFAANDTWPNHDGTFEFISNPDVSRRPKQNFFVQIKGTSVYTEKDGIIKYSVLKAWLFLLIYATTFRLIREYCSLYLIQISEVLNGYSGNICP